MAISDTDVRATSSLRIGDLSDRTAVSPRSLRYYEQQGLLRARRTPAGHRRFEPEAVDRVLLIQRLFAAGLSSADIRPVLPGMVGEGQRSADLVTELRAHRARLRQEVERQLDAIDILDEVLEEHDTPA